MAETIQRFAEIIVAILKTDRWVFNVVTGGMGEGKSCFSSQTANATAKLINTPFSYKDNMTFSRKELKIWIDGDKEGKHRKPEHSVILADEIISMFFKRNWYDSDQIDGIELLNKCRDRHLCVFGNVPNFWDLDSAIYSTVTFWVHIYERGRAWVFQSDRNPFANDKWHKKENQKMFWKRKNPYNCHGFVCEIAFDDWSPEEKKLYYEVRNKKRVRTEGQRARVDRYKDIKKQRDAGIVAMFKYNEDVVVAAKQCCDECQEKLKDIAIRFTNKGMGEAFGISLDAARMIKLGLR